MLMNKIHSTTIFVSIASYCDPELPRTLNDCIDKAQHPSNLRFGICWQYDPEHPVDIEKFKRDPRFQFIEFPIEKSQGGTWARYKAQKLWAGESYTLQVDSHMHFEPEWDTKLIHMIENLPSEKPLITVNSPVFTYCSNGTIRKDTSKGVPTCRVQKWKEKSGWAPWSVWGKPNTQHLGRTRFITGNFVFTLGQWTREVPQDPGHYYWGEEFSLTVRSFTHGYDLFLPNEIVAWHMNHGATPPRRHWEHGIEVVSQKNAVAFERLRTLLYSENESEQEILGIYGLGHVRTKRDYEIYAGMDLKNKKAHPDVFLGNNPDPVTIHTQADWERCITIEEFNNTYSDSLVG